MLYQELLGERGEGDWEEAVEKGKKALQELGVLDEEGEVVEEPMQNYIVFYAPKMGSHTFTVGDFSVEQSREPEIIYDSQGNIEDIKHKRGSGRLVIKAELPDKP